MNEVDQIRSLAKDFYEEEEGTLNIAATNTQARYVLPEILRKLRNQYPNVHLNLHQGTAEQVADLMSGNDIDFAISSDSDNRFNDLLKLPGYQWDKVILVPNDHPLTKLDHKLTHQDLADYPLVSYVFSFENDQALRDSFEGQGLNANIVFTARDSEVIKTYVRMGAGIGIIAGMAYEPTDRNDLTAIPARGLFPRSTTWIGIRKNTMIRCYMADFLKLFAPHLNCEQIERATRANNQQEVNQLVRGAGLPVRNGFSNKLSAAA
jgi:LysR family cys regulon transcriptional activator